MDELADLPVELGTRIISQDRHDLRERVQKVNKTPHGSTLDKVYSQRRVRWQAGAYASVCEGSISGLVGNPSTHPEK